ncbi:uncharacterized protein LOC125189902 [Salvia hispanica]|uniref:uncharacterized protein LOC125189902 n=1 Tax=Salvia hispanica TaxID=49212 RepID=UPI002009BA45|nr:uncharacterized protein LOC125189902 [Salvia hispanica]
MEAEAVGQVGSLVDPNMMAGAARAGRIAEVRAAGVGWVGSNKLVEIWCLFHGVHLAKNLGIRKLIVESNSAVEVAMMMGHFEVTVNCQNIVERLRGLLQDFESVVIQHVHREGNFAADFLSHYAYSFHKGVHVLEGPPPGMNVWLLHDRLGVTYLR